MKTVLEIFSAAITERDADGCKQMKTVTETLRKTGSAMQLNLAVG
jgi:hypothetical protein